LICSGRSLLRVKRCEDRRIRPPGVVYLARLIALARRRLKQAVGARVARYGLSPQQFWTMVFLDEEDGPTLTQICDRLRADAPTASRIVGALTRRGLVRPARDASDRRCTLLKLTPAGRRLAAELQPLAAEIRGVVERDLDRSEVAELRRLLNKVIDSLDRYQHGRSRRMKNTALAALALATAATVSCSRASAASHARGPAAVPVVVTRAALEDVADRIEAVATVEPMATVSVKAQAGGRIERVFFAEGQDVRKGELLFQIDPRPYQAALAQAEGGLAHDVAQAQNAATQASRAAQLAAEGILSREDHDQATANAAAQKASAAADAAAVESARLSLAYTQVRAPISGRTGSVLVQVGNVVKAGDDTPLVVINRIDPIYVSFAVPEQRLAALRGAQSRGALQVEATISGDPDPVKGGRLTFIDNQLDRASGTIRLKATFDNPSGRLWPGQFVNARLTLGVQASAVVVPTAAVQAGQKGSYLFVMKADKTVEQRPVVSRATSDASTSVIEKGVQAGETVVVDGQLGLTNGTPVQVKPAAGAGDESRGAEQ
jgi:multidrug efflux system membrane fusion protein